MLSANSRISLNVSQQLSIHFEYDQRPFGLHSFEAPQTMPMLEFILLQIRAPAIAQRNCTAMAQSPVRPVRPAPSAAPEPRAPFAFPIHQFCSSQVDMRHVAEKLINRRITLLHPTLHRREAHKVFIKVAIFAKSGKLCGQLSETEFLAKCESFLKLSFLIVIGVPSSAVTNSRKWGSEACDVTLYGEPVSR
jgi:hypothetical protein